MKNTIIISVATYFVLNFLIWMLGWVIWPILWVGSGLLFFRLGNSLANDEESNSDKMGWAMASIMGPALGVVVLCCFWENVSEKTPFFPKIRNPFIWPEKHDD